MRNNKFKSEVSAVVKEISHNKKSLASFALAAAALAGAVTVNLSHVSTDNTSAEECSNATCNTTFEVDVEDALTVSLTTPETGATGNVGSFLRNTVDLDVTSNASNGFTASMYSSTDNAGTDKTSLTHSSLGASDSYDILTLASSTTRGDFPTDRWGYSLESASMDGKNYGETDAGNNSSNYYPLTADSTDPIKLLSAAAGTKTGSQSIYFGAKASASKPSGTYNNTVVISVVTGNVDAPQTDPPVNPITPSNPATPSIDTPNDNTATYTGSTGTGATRGVGISGTTGTTVYTTSTTSGTGTAATTTTTTEVTGGDNTSTYVAPQGVKNTEIMTLGTASQSNSTLPISLAATAVGAATAGTIFFILAKKHDDDDEEEDQQ